MSQAFGHFGVLDAGLEVETRPMVTAARELDELGLDALQKASLFGNCAALLAMKGGLSRTDYLELCTLLWESTEVQMALLRLPRVTGDKGVG